MTVTLTVIGTWIESMIVILVGRHKNRLEVERKTSHSENVEGRLENGTKTWLLYAIQAHHG